MQCRRPEIVCEFIVSVDRLLTGQAVVHKIYFKIGQWKLANRSVDK